MLSLRKPSATALRRIVAAQSQLNFTYAPVGATATLPHTPLPTPHSYIIDHTRVELGQGAAIFERAKAALATWQQFRLGWLEAFPEDTPLRAGETVLVVARAGGLWWTNAARIVYTIDEPHSLSSLDGESRRGVDARTDTARFGFAYGTLPDHVESGEERFLIEWDGTTDQVWFDILAFSRPRSFLVRLNRRHARAMQKRFGAESAAVMKALVPLPPGEVT